ncbi:MAG: hypothetical protein COA75_01570 [Cellvibrionales bacterium]|nr:MAG: hypothetical protein COA75_01570 [Cellvibrionales bacterium]
MIKNKILIFLLIAFSTMSFNVFSFFPETNKDFSLLPAFCKVRAGRGTAVEVTLWKKRLGSDYIHIHHFCAGLHSYNYTTMNFPKNKDEKAFHRHALRSVLGEVNYMESHVKNKKFVMFPSIYLLKAKAHADLGQRAKALVYYNKSITANKKFTRAYLSLSRYYQKLGDKTKALAIIEQGLQYKPSSKSLNRQRNHLTQ